MVSEERESELRQRIRTGSQELRDFRELATLLVSADRYTEAIELYRQALNLPLTNPQKAQVLIEQGWIFYEGLGQRQQALKLGRDACSMLLGESDSPEALLLRGVGQSLVAHSIWLVDPDAGAREAQKALGWLERVIRESPAYEGSSLANGEAAKVLNLLGDTNKAIAYGERYLRHDLNDVDRLSGLVVLAEAFRRQGRFADAERTLEESFRYVKTHRRVLPIIYFNLGLVQRGTNRLADARKSFEEALRVVQDDPHLRNDSHFLTELHWNLGEMCYEVGNYREAAAAFRLVVNLQPKDNEYRCNALLWLGHSYLGMGDYAGGRRCYEDVLATRDASEEQKAAAKEGLQALPTLPKKWLHGLGKLFGMR